MKSPAGVAAFRSRTGREHADWQGRDQARVRSVAASARTSERVSRAGRVVDDRAHLMVVPTIGIIVHNHDHSAFPLRPLLEEVDRADDEVLFVKRIRVAGMAVLVGRSLEEAYLGKVVSVSLR